MQYSHYVIAHGKALAECLSQRRPLSDSKYKTTFVNYNFIQGKISLNSVQPPGLQKQQACPETGLS